MNFESLGTCGSAERFDGRAMAELGLGIAFLKEYVGEPPQGCWLQIVNHEHELGEYGTIALCWNIGPLGDEGWHYYRQCADALPQVDAAVDWSSLSEVLWKFNEDGQDDQEVKDVL